MVATIITEATIKVCLGMLLMSRLGKSSGTFYCKSRRDAFSSQVLLHSQTHDYLLHSPSKAFCKEFCTACVEFSKYTYKS